MANTKLKTLAVVLLAFLLGCHSNAFAAQSYLVNGGSTYPINEWGVCRNVTNAGGWPAIFVPTNSAAEWNAFLNNHPSHVSLGSCGKIIPNDAIVHVWVQHGCGPGYEFASPVTSLPQYFCGNACGNPNGEMTYTVYRVGNYIQINPHHYFLWAVYNVPGMPGGNINAVEIVSPSMYPSGIWATSVISYRLGVQGIAASTVNILGTLWDGGIGISIPGWGVVNGWTYLGDYESEIVVGF